MNFQSFDNGLIYTDSKNCIGCNNCIRECPTLEANIGVMDDNGVCKIHLDDKECILCGTCLDTCTHNVRRFVDDCEKFFNDLKWNEKISVLIAPAFLLNYPNEYKSILGYLKSFGVRDFYSVSFGADITTWAYLNYIQRNNAFGKISQPCPAIVSHIERHQPELIDSLMPVQSPMMCSAIYLRKYLGITDRLAFISPCIAKKTEMESERGLGIFDYNVTFKNLMQYIRDKDVNLNEYPELDDQIDYGLGSLFPMPGGLRENVEFFLGEDALVVQAEGELHVYDYLRNFKDRQSTWRNMGITPTLVDVLNCVRGCNYGTASEYRHSDNDFVQIEAHKLRKEKRAAFKIKNADNTGVLEESKRNLAILNDKFSSLNIEDFLCRYEVKATHKRNITSSALEAAYQAMLKKSDKDKIFDCCACGYKSCKAMASALALGINYKENCAEYIKMIVKEQMEYQRSVIDHFKAVGQLILELNDDNVRISTDATTINERVDDAINHGEKMHQALSNLQDEFRKINASYGQITSVAQTSNILSINASIEAANAGVMGKGFGVIAEEVRMLANKILSVSRKNENDSSSITKVLEELVESVTTFTDRIDSIKGSTGEIKTNVGSITSRTQDMMDLMHKLV